MTSSSSSSSPEIPSATCTETQQSRFSYENATHEEVLEDLSSRFILNLPDHELGSLERVCFQVEQAHWFYEDFIREENSKFPSLPLKRFSAMLFESCPLLYQWSHDHEQAFNRFMQYKTRVPVCGAIMLNDAMDKCVLVKGWKSSSGWGFPKGKINETEPPPTCAIREVLEETGYNLAGKLDPQNVVEMSINEQRLSLFIVPGVPEDYAFKTKTRKEISRIEWFKLTDLPTWRRNKSVSGKFYLITPFIGPLKAFINERKHKPPRKAVKQKKTHQAVTESHSIETAHDYHPIQESSSQSSSFDIIGPETPSESDLNSTLRVEDNRSETSASQVEMDPHVARLLDSLALSAAAASESYANEKSTKAAGDEAKSIVSSSATNSDSSDDSSFISHAHGVDQYKGSSSLPSQVSQQMSVSSLAQSIHDHSTLDPPRSYKTSSTLTVRPKISLNGITHMEENLNNGRIAYPTSVLTSPSTLATRRATSTADISPYLTRAADVPISATRLKQLSLLETVADESARMSTTIAARAAMTSTNPVVNGYPLPSMSVPPQPMVLGNLRDPGVIYSSDHPRVPSHAHGSQPVYNPSENNFHGEHDAFQVRSRTSQSFHRTLMHNPTGSINIQQNHLLAAMNGSRAPLMDPSHPYSPQFMQHQPPQMHSVGPPLHGASMHPRYIPPPQMISSFSPAPQPLPSAVAGPYHRTSFNCGLHPTTVNPSYNPSLLSILNTRSSQPATVPAQLHQ